MLSSELLELAATRIRIEFEERRERFGRELQEIQSELSLQGLGTAGAAQEATQQALMRELDIRAMLVWQAMSRILSSQSLAIDAELNRQLKEEVVSHLAAGCDDLITIHRFTCENLPGGALPSFEAMRERALAKTWSEIDISLLTVQRSQEAEGAQTTINIYQPYGIVQTGDGSIAHLTQSFDAGSRSALERALGAVEQALINAQALSATERAQAQDVIREVQTELAGTQPNVHKIRGLLLAIAIVIQALGSAGPAYGLLKAAAALIGVHLP